MIISASILQYNTFDIKRALDTKISELSDSGVYDYISYPTYDVQSPYTSGPFWKGDTILIKWNYTEATNDLIPSTSIYLMSGSNQTLLFENIPTEYKNINWTIPKSVKNKTTYFIKVQSNVDNEIIADVSPTFTFDTRTIEITSKAPTPYIVANQGETYTLTWDGKGLGTYFRIELIDATSEPEINFEKKIGRIIRNPDEQQQGEIVENNEPPINEVQSANIIKVLEDKYYTTDGRYVWTADGIDNYSINFVKIKITDIINSITAVSPEIMLSVPHISISQVGRGVQLDLTGPSVITGSGEGEADISAYAFSPSSFTVTSGSNFSFSYASTNAIQVYLKKESDQYYFEEIPLTGTHTINNITQDEVYTLHAKDSNQRLKTAVLNIKLKVEDPIENNDIKTFTLYELLSYASLLMREAQTSGDAVIDPTAPVNSKISFYATEASQTTENTNKEALWYLLKNLNTEVLYVLLNGSDTPPVILLFNGTPLRDKIYKLNQEIADRYYIKINNPQKVSGRVSDSSNNPISGITLRFNEINLVSHTDTNGYYEGNVPYLYSSSLVPISPDYSFEPLSKDFINTPVIGEVKNVNFIGIPQANQVKNLSLNVSGLDSIPGLVGEVGNIHSSDPAFTRYLNESFIRSYIWNNIAATEIAITIKADYIFNMTEFLPYVNGVYMQYTTEVINTNSKDKYNGGKIYRIPVPYANSVVSIQLDFDLQI